MTSYPKRIKSFVIKIFVFTIRVEILKVFRSESYFSTYVETTAHVLKPLIFDTYGIIKWLKASKDQNVATCYMHKSCVGYGCGF
jgi:hypothetical protein